MPSPLPHAISAPKAAVSTPGIALRVWQNTIIRQNVISYLSASTLARMILVSRLALDDASRQLYKDVDLEQLSAVMDNVNDTANSVHNLRLPTEQLLGMKSGQVISLTVNYPDLSSINTTVCECGDDSCEQRTFDVNFVRAAGSRHVVAVEVCSPVILHPPDFTPSIEAEAPGRPEWVPTCWTLEQTFRLRFGDEWWYCDELEEEKAFQAVVDALIAREGVYNRRIRSLRVMPGSGGGMLMAWLDYQELAEDTDMGDDSDTEAGLHTKDVGEDYPASGIPESKSTSGAAEDICASFPFNSLDHIQLAPEDHDRATTFNMLRFASRYTAHCRFFPGVLDDNHHYPGLHEFLDDLIKYGGARLVRRFQTFEVHLINESWDESGTWHMLETESTGESGTSASSLPVIPPTAQPALSDKVVVST